MEDSVQPKGWSEDGYIVDQDCFSEYRYRNMPADINACGPIAVYNLLHYLDRETDFSQLLREMEALHRMPGPGPTSMRVMRLYLKALALPILETEGRELARTAASCSRAGIFRYWEGQEPHFISFIRRENGLFRFFNVADGLEDCEMSMDQFAQEHLKGGLVIALTLGTV